MSSRDYYPDFVTPRALKSVNVCTPEKEEFNPAALQHTPLQFPFEITEFKASWVKSSFSCRDAKKTLGIIVVWALVFWITMDPTRHEAFRLDNHASRADRPKAGCQSIDRVVISLVRASCTRDLSLLIYQGTCWLHS
jgi:hypothetical protein